MAVLSLFLLFAGAALSLFLFFAGTTPSQQEVDWFVAPNLSEATKTALTEQACFRGTYGAQELSIFTCNVEGVEGKQFARLPIDAPLCVVETDTLESTLGIVAGAQDTKLLFVNEGIVVLSAIDMSDYPSTCGSRSDYHGAALNVVRVPRQPHAPVRPLTPMSSPLAINPKIVAIANRITAAQLQNTVTNFANYHTRHSQSVEARAAVVDFAQQLRDVGASVTTSWFRDGYCNNTIGEIRGVVSPNSIVMIGAHLDDRANISTSTTQRAPGADDNASGLSVVLALARAIVAEGATFSKTIRFAGWCGEEQGLYGSTAYANDAKSKGVNIDAYLNVDMLGYQPGATPVLGVVSSNVAAAFTQEIRDVVGEYYPGLVQASTTACCSDQQPFNTNGYQAGGLFEQGGPRVTYPAYHTTVDLPSRLNYDQLQAFGRAAAVVFANRAGIL